MEKRGKRGKRWASVKARRGGERGLWKTEGKVEKEQEDWDVGWEEDQDRDQDQD